MPGKRDNIVGKSADNVAKGTKTLKTPEKNKNNESILKKALSKPIFQERDYKKLDSGNKARADKLLKEIYELKMKLDELLQ